MATRGDTSKPTNAAEGWGLNVENNFGVEITMPSGGPWRITKLGAWLAGWNATPEIKLAIWNGTTGTLLGESASFNAANGGSIGNTNSDNYEKNLLSDVVVSGGADIIVGFARDESEAIQFSTRSSGRHRDKDGATGIPTADILSGGSWHGTGDLGAYVANYVADNDPPEAPSITEPDSEEIKDDTTPNFSFTHNDPDGDPIGAIQVQVREYPSASDWSDLVWDSGKDSESDETPTITSGVTLTRGQGYYVRARTWDDSDEAGPYSSGRRFFIAAKPTGSVTNPSGNGVVAPLYYDAGSATTPKFRITWSFNCPDGGTCTSTSVKVYADDGAGNPAALQHTHVHSGAGLTAELSAYTPAADTVYHVSVTHTCSHGTVGDESTKIRCKTRWGRASYYKDLGSTPLDISVTPASTANNGTVVLEHGFTANAAGEPGTWYSDIASATKNQFVWHRVTMMPQAVASPTSPALDSVRYDYSASVPVADKWTLSTVGAVDTGAKFYGTQSLKHTAVGTDKFTTQVVAVEQDTDYILSGRMKTLGTVTATLELHDGTSVVATAAADDDADWTRYSTGVWNSGEASSVTIRLRTQGTGSAWWDALKMEASVVVTPWTPGFIGSAVTLDAGGLGISGVGGGIFRLQGSTGGTLDTVKLGTRGLNFGDTQVYGSASGAVTVDGDLFADNVPRMLAYDIDATDNSYTATETICSCDNVVVAANRLIRITGNIAINPSAAGQTTLRLSQEGVQVGFWKEQFASGNSADNKGATVVAIVSSGAGGTFDYLFTAEGSVSMSADGSTIAPSTLLVEDIGPA